MGVQLDFMIEVQDSEKNWHLVNWFTNTKFESYPLMKKPTIEIWGTEYRRNNEFYPGLAWRDEISWGASDLFKMGIPDDASEGLKKVVEDDLRDAREFALRNMGKESDIYAKKYYYALLSEMNAYCHKKLEGWKKTLLTKISDKKLDAISDQLGRIEGLIKNNGEEPKKAKKKKSEDDDYYENTLEYVLEEELTDVLALLREANGLSNIVTLYTDDNWFDSDKVRVIYFLS